MNPGDGEGQSLLGPQLGTELPVDQKQPRVGVARVEHDPGDPCSQDVTDQ